MTSRSSHLSALLLLVITPIVFSSFPLIPQIPIENTLKTTIFTHKPALFNIPTINVSLIGTFTISAELIEQNDSLSLVVSRQACNKGEGIKYRDLYNQGNYNEGSSVLFFMGNSSEDNCFQVEVLHSTKNTSLEVNILVSFSPNETFLNLNEYASVQFASKSGKELILQTNQSNPEIFLVSFIDPINNPANSEFCPLQVKIVGGVCLKGTNWTFLCHLPAQNLPIKFAFYNVGPTSQFEIKVKEIKPENYLIDSDAIINPTIPGFGTLVRIELPTAGVLKLFAKAKNVEFLPIVASSSLQNIFLSFLGDNPETEFYDLRKSDSNEPLLYPNKEPVKQMFYFVQTQSKNPFHLISYFIKQVTVEIDTESMYFIDPRVYEYQYIEFKLGSRSFPEKYEVTVQSLQTDSMVNIYYDTKNYENSYSFFPDQQLYRKKASALPVNSQELSLSFIVGSHDTSAFITIHALTRGLYVVKATKVEPRSIWQGIFIVAFLSGIIAYIFSCVSRIFKLAKSNEFDELPEWMDFNVSISTTAEPSSAPQREEEVPAEVEVEVVVEDPAEVEQVNAQIQTIKNLVQMSKKLRKLERIERKEKLVRKKQNEALSQDQHGTLEDLDDENRCDICFEGKKTVVFGPCKHACACAYCSLVIVETSAKCPLCRAKIEKVSINKKNVGNKSEESIKDKTEEKENKEDHITIEISKGTEEAKPSSC